MEIVRSTGRIPFAACTFLNSLVTYIFECLVAVPFVKGKINDERIVMKPARRTRSTSFGKYMKFPIRTRPAWQTMI